MDEEELIERMMAQHMSSAVVKTLQRAKELDDLSEDDAVCRIALELWSADPPLLSLAALVGMLAIRWHRSQQTEAAVNNPGPGR